MSFPWRPVLGRILVAAIGIEVLILALAVGNDIRQTETRLLRQIEDDAALLTPVLSSAIAAPLRLHDVGMLRAVLDESRTARAMLYLVVLDRHGEIVASSGWPEAMPLPPASPSLVLTGLADQRRYDVVRDIVGSDGTLGRLHFGLDLLPVIEARQEMLEQGVALTIIGGALTALVLGLIGLWLGRRPLSVPPPTEGGGEPPRHNALEARRIAESRTEMLEKKLGRLSLNIRRLRLAQTFANIASWEFDIRSRDIHHSERLPMLLGLGIGETKITYDVFVRALHPDDRATALRAFSRAMREKRPYEVEHRVVLADGSERWLYEQGAVVCDRNGRPARMLGITQDIHRRKMAEESLRKLSVAVEQSPASVLITDPGGAIEYANATLLRTYGYRLDEMIGQTPRLFKSDDKPLATYKALWNTILSGETWHGEFHNRRKNGSLVWVAASIAPVKNQDGRITHFLCLSEDIGARKAAELEAEENRRRLDEAQSLAGLGSWDYDPTSGILSWSETTFTIFGHNPATFTPSLGAFFAAIHPDDRAIFEDTHRRRDFSNNEELLIRIVRPDGEVRHVLARTRLVSEPDGRADRLVGTILDVTEREKANANRDLFRRLVDDAGQAIRISEPNGRIMFVNKAFLSLTGFTREAVEGRTYTDFIAAPEAEAAADVARAYAERRSWSGLLDIRRADGTEFTSLCNVGVVLDARGRAQYLFTIFSDYTTEIERERELCNARDAAEAASQAKSAFLANMSHELRTPMNAILGFSQFLDMDPNLSDSHRDSVMTIYKAGRHLLDLINEILDLARIEAGRIDLSIESVPVEPVLRDCLDLIAPLAQERGIAIILTSPGPGLIARADPLRLKQVLVNLLSNAIKYNRPNGTVRLIARRSGPETLQIDVADTGQGIAPERLAELFIPFNRLGAEYTDTEGTGIGLALTRRIVEAMSGTVGVESEPGRGSVFWTELRAEPARADSTETVPTPEANLHDESQITATVLYIDDDPVNLKLIEQVFSTLAQLRLITAPAPGLGLDLARLRRPDLILLDINLPGMDGHEVLARLRADPLTRAIPVAAVTALAMARDIERGREAGFDAYLTKPIDIPLLLETVRALITADEAGPADRPAAIPPA
ncbi:PAS domain S-box protein [Magnetospirillum molischianum]|uniref:histidine kinase n=1 Tax=Magnetospirillum molischianum DSM 120 TaxID=1150626 RepID=H8FSY0_MAGML|nr:PAS domain S-box protein [Magnetospirillum molischianum]CCG41468.1 Putative two-component sensor histidine kinase (modular protein), hybrid system [Magnetospirillum molischianum DSM 120]